MLLNHVGRRVAVVVAEGLSLDMMKHLRPRISIPLIIVTSSIKELNELIFLFIFLLPFEWHSAYLINDIAWFCERLSSLYVWVFLQVFDLMIVCLSIYFWSISPCRAFIAFLCTNQQEQGWPSKATLVSLSSGFY